MNAGVILTFIINLMKKKIDSISTLISTKQFLYFMRERHKVLQVLRFQMIYYL